MTVDCRRFVWSGCLSFVIVSLSSLQYRVREAASHILSRFKLHLESSKFREKAQVWGFSQQKKTIMFTFVVVMVIFLSSFLGFISFRYLYFVKSYKTLFLTSMLFCHLCILLWWQKPLAFSCKQVGWFGIICLSVKWHSLGFWYTYVIQIIQSISWCPISWCTNPL